MLLWMELYMQHINMYTIAIANGGHQASTCGLQLVFRADS